MEEIKFLDQEGVKYLWSKISMEDYPNNETLMAVINAIDQTKADKSEAVLFSTAQELTGEQRKQARDNISNYKWRTIQCYNGMTYEIADAFEFMNNSEAKINWDIVETVPNISDAGDNVNALSDIVDWVHVIFSNASNDDLLMPLNYIAGNMKALMAAGAIYDTIWLHTRNRIYDTIFRTICISSINEILTVNLEANEYNTIGYITYSINDNTIIKNALGGLHFDRTLTQRGDIAEAKAVGDALTLKIDRSEIATDDEIIEMLIQEDMLPVVTDSDENGDILLW